MTTPDAPGPVPDGPTASYIIGLAEANFDAFLRQRANVEMLDSWQTSEHESDLFIPRAHEISTEYYDLAERSPTPLLGLIVSSLSQTAYVDGVSLPDGTENLDVWRLWVENGFQARQIPLHRAAIAHGIAYGTCLPGRSPVTGDRSAIMRGVSGKRMAAFYDDEGEDEWPEFAIRAEQVSNLGDSADEPGWAVRLIDDHATHYLTARGNGSGVDSWTYIRPEPHPMGVPPVVRYTNRIDLEGHSTGEIEPLIPLAKRLDQDTFDRLIVQRFGAWKIRYAAGLVKPTSASDAEAQKIKLAVEDILVSSSPDTKFGTLDETQIDGFIGASDHDLRMLSAVSQTPPYHLLGLSANLQAEALAAAAEGLRHKSAEFKTAAAESHEKLLRLGAKAIGNTREMRAYDMAVRWRDTEARSLSQAADALGKLAQMLNVPQEMLWERIPNWTDSDTARAKALLESGGVDSLIDELLANEGTERTQRAHAVEPGSQQAESAQLAIPGVGGE